MGTILLLLGPEGDRLDAFAAMHGVAASAALSLERCQRGNRRIGRQTRAATALASGLARAFLDESDGPAALIDLMERADRLGRIGIPYDQLVTMPAEWPFKGLPINPPALALVAVMRLRQALQDRLIATAGTKQRVQLQIVRELERDVLALARELKQHSISSATAVRRLRTRFAAAQPAIDADLSELLGTEPAALPGEARSVIAAA